MSWDQIVSTLQGFGWNYLATLLMAAVVSYLGLFTVLRRIVFTGVALAQVAAAGVGAAFWVADAVPAVARFASSYGATLGSFLLTLGAAFGLRVGPSRRRVGGDALVGFIYVVSAALAVLFVWRSSRGLAELREILSGEVLLTSRGELLLLSVALTAVALIHFKFRKRFLIVSYDPEFASTLGLKVARIDLLFLATFATAVAFSLRAGGLLLVFAFLVLPGMTGLVLGRRLREARLLCVATALTGSMGGYLFAIVQNLPVAHSISALLGGLLVMGWCANSVVVLAHFFRGAILLGGLSSIALALWLLPALGSSGEGVTPWSIDPHQGHQHGVPEAPGDAERLAAAIGHLRGDGTDEQKIAAAGVVGEIGDWESLPILLLAFGEESPLVKSAVSDGARVFMKRRGTARIRALAVSKDAELAAQTSRVLLKLNDPLGAGYLIAFLEREKAPLLLRDTVHSELQEATGQSFGYDPFMDPPENREAIQKWWAWWETNRPS